MWRSLSTVLGGRPPLPLESSVGPATERAGRVATHATAEPAVPDLVGLPASEARRRARLGGLAVDVTERAASRGLWGRVLDQSPPAGSPAEPEGGIRLTVGARPHVSVPDVRGRDEDEALFLLREAGLGTARRATRRSERVPEGCVVRTRPRAGADVPLGSRISYVVAMEPRPRGGGGREADRRRVRVGRLPDGSFQTFPDE